MEKSYFETYKRHPYQDHFNENNLLNITNYKNTIILDLIDTFYSICYYDFYTPRNEDSNNVISLNIPVNNIEKFNKIIPLINNLIKFMTNGETWNITFSKCEKEKYILKHTQLSFEPQYDSIALLSGGLDALAGAAQETNNKTIFITYATNKIEKSKAKFSYNNYISNFCTNSSHIIIDKQNLDFKTHLTQRTRSLIFLASCFIYTDYYNIHKIKIYENGIMTLNPTFYFRRKVTRTTHPKTLFLVNSILKELELDIEIINPFNFLTKKDVVNLIPNQWNSLIKDTKTCSKMPASKAFFNHNEQGYCHCGICAACLLRQISLFNSTKNGLDVDYIVPSNLFDFNNLVKYETETGLSFEKKYIEDLCKYRYIEKKSLIEYYKLFKKNIDNGEIFKYLNLHPKYFNEIDYMQKYNNMLSNFSQEINEYINSLDN